MLQQLCQRPQLVRRSCRGWPGGPRRFECEVPWWLRSDSLAAKVLPSMPSAATSGDELALAWAGVLARAGDGVS